MNWFKRLFKKEEKQPNNELCPVCGEPGKLQFIEENKSKPYISCDKHQVRAILMSLHSSWQKNNK